jgi:hypothetical protein
LLCYNYFPADGILETETLNRYMIPKKQICSLLLR